MAVADAVYKLAGLAETYAEAAESEGVREVWNARNLAQRALGPEPSGAWEAVMPVLASAAWALTSIPLPHGSEALGLAEMAAKLRALAPGAVGSGLDGLVDGTAAVLDELARSNRDPLGDAAREILSTATRGGATLAIAPRSAVGAVSQAFLDQGRSVPVYSRDQLARLSPCETLLLIGPTRWFPAAVTTAPRAECTCFVQYSWLGIPRTGEPLLPWTRSALSRPIRFSFAIDQVQATSVDEDTGPEPDWGTIEARMRARVQAPSLGEPEVRARLLLLAGGQAVYVEEDDGAELVVAILDSQGDLSVARRAARTILPGDFVVLRSSGSDRDYIREIADQRFGAAPWRADQRRWKNALAEAVDAAGGIAAARRELRRRGAGATNIGYWLSPTSIRTRSAHDFRVVCQFAGLGPDGPALWRAMERIASAHVEAGFFLRQQLVNYLVSLGPDELERDGCVEVDLEGCGSLSVHRVEARGPEVVKVPASAVRQPFSLGGAVWLG